MKKSLLSLTVFLFVGGNIFSMDINKLIDEKSHEMSEDLKEYDQNIRMKDLSEKRKKKYLKINKIVNTSKQAEQRERLIKEKIALMGTIHFCVQCQSYQFIFDQKDYSHGCFCERKFKCTYPGCQESYGKKSSLIRHMSWHTRLTY